MDVAKGFNRSVARLGRSKPRRGGMRLSMFDTPVARPNVSGAPRASVKERKLLSLELELGGMAVEFKARNLAGLLGWLAINAGVAAVIQQLAQPRQFRTWHGRVAGVIPYDFRRPTIRRLLDTIWAPGNPKLFTDTAFGLGWSLNLAQLPRVLAKTNRQAAPQQAYEAPSVGTKA